MVELVSSVQSVTAFAPATCANVAVGFDLLGFAFGCVGDEVTLTRCEGATKIVEIDSAQPLPTDPAKNVASSVILKVCKDHAIHSGFEIKIKKGIALGSGMGGSAASSVAALTALNAFFEEPFTLEELVPYAMYGEQVASGALHADNVVPCLYGGLTLTDSLAPINVIELPVLEMICVLVHPELRVDTRDAREVLPEHMPLSQYVDQSRHLSGFVAALFLQDFSLLTSHLKDVLIEPHRAKLVKGFERVKASALAAGALGSSLSGSGPTMFALAKGLDAAHTISKAMVAAFAAENISANTWIGPIDLSGAKTVNRESK